jgi:hypothetical protein
VLLAVRSEAAATIHAERPVHAASRPCRCGNGAKHITVRST